MAITNTQAQGRVRVAVLAVQGDLDASNFQDLIAEAKHVYQGGVQHILLDLTSTGFMSSSGLVALHSIALLLQNSPLPNLEDGWSTIHSLGRGLASAPLKQLKLLNPNAKIERTLEKAGMKEFFEVFTDQAAAIASY